MYREVLLALLLLSISVGRSLLALSIESKESAEVTYSRKLVIPGQHYQFVDQNNEVFMVTVTELSFLNNSMSTVAVLVGSTAVCYFRLSPEIVGVFPTHDFECFHDSHGIGIYLPSDWSEEILPNL